MDPHLHFILVDLVAALVPLIVGMVWYNPKVFGAASMAAAGVTPERMQGANMALIFFLTYLFSFFLAITLNFVVLHQFHLYSLLDRAKGADNPSSDVNIWLNNGMSMFQHTFRTYRHGAFHGFLFAIGTAFPMIGVNALFERRGFKYLAINVGFWIACCVIMGAIICHWQIVYGK